MAMEEDFLLDAEDDARAVAFIQSYLPQDLKDKFTEDDLYYILDLIAEYYTSSECLDAEPDEEGYINIDLDEVVDYVVKQAAKEGEMGPYAPEDVFFVVQGEMEYGDSLEEGCPSASFFIERLFALLKRNKRQWLSSVIPIRHRRVAPVCVLHYVQ